MRFAALLRLSYTWLAFAMAFLFSAPSCPQETRYDDDTDLTFVWGPAEGDFDHYNAYVSVDGGAYQLAGTASSEQFTVVAQDGHRYKLRVCAVTSDGREGPFSPESDPVVCDTLAPLAPVISDTYDVLSQTTVVVTLLSNPSDANFSNYQVVGGQYAVWKDSAATKGFTFTIDPATRNILEIREKDLAGNAGPSDSIVVENLNGDNDSDGVPNYWELMYPQILNPDNPADANLDTDSDGYTNLQEYLAATDPTQADPAPPDATPPATSGHSPAKGATDVPVGANISLHITDSGDGVDKSSIVMTVRGSTVAPVITGTPADYLVTYDPPSDFGYSETITVTINAEDLHSPPSVMPRETYTFKTAAQPDNTPPATTGHFPANGATGLSISTNISFHIGDSGDGVSKSSIAMSVNGSTVAPVITGTPADYFVTYDPPSDFGYSQTVTVTIDAQDLHSPANVMLRETYTFNTMAQTGDPSTFSATVSVSRQGKGLQVEVDGTRYAETKSFTWEKGSTHTLKAVAPQIGNDTYRYSFDHWSDSGDETHSVTANGNANYTVYYVGEPASVSVTVSVSRQGKGLQVEVDGTRYAEIKSFTWEKGSGHTLKAVTPQVGNNTYRYTFDHWSDGGAETHTVTANQDATYTVYYTGASTTVGVTVSVSPHGKGLQVEVDGTRYTETQSFTWEEGSGHTLKPVAPQVGNDTYRYNFDRWSDAGAETRTVTVNGNAAYTVNYITSGATVWQVNVALGPTPDDTTLMWDSISTESYSVFYSYDLLAWQLANANVPSAGDETTFWVDDGSETGAAPSKVKFRFYRVMKNP